MKKLLVVIISFLITSLNVYAENLISVSGEKNLIVGYDSNYIVKINADGIIEKLNISFSVSDNLKIDKVDIGSSFSKVSSNGNNYVLSSNVNNGNVFNISLKGISVGSGKLSISKCVATINGSLVNLLDTSYDIIIINNDALDRAKRLVDKATRSLDRVDYENALNSVKTLRDDSDKVSLNEKLNEISNKIIEDDVRAVCDDNSKSKKIWMYLSIGLLICLVIESSYIIYLKEK